MVRLNLNRKDRRVGALRRRLLLAGPERGAVAVVVALLMTALVIVTAVVVDLGNARDQRRQSQNASDAAALAAVNVLYPTAPAVNCSSGPAAPPCFTAAVAAVKAYASANFGTATADWTGCSITAAQKLTYTPTGESSCISFDSQTAPKKVRVWMPTKSVSTFFAGVIGRSSIAVGSQADAVVLSTVKCTLCFLGGVDARNADFDVTGGSIAVNGNVDAGPNSNWTSLVNGVVGTVNGGQFAPAATPIQPFSDPLATSLTLPINLAAMTAKTNPCTQGPGRYDSNVNIPNNATCTLTPGFYGIKGTWQLGNNSNLVGTGVTLYAQAPSGYLDFKNGNVNISAGATGYSGYAVIYDRNNTNDLSLQGNGATGISGITYAPASRLDFNGNSCFGFSGGPVVVAGVNLANGNQSCVRITNPVDQEVTRTPLHLTQ